MIGVILIRWLRGLAPFPVFLSNLVFWIDMFFSLEGPTHSRTMATKSLVEPNP